MHTLSLRFIVCLVTVLVSGSGKQLLLTYLNGSPPPTYDAMLATQITFCANGILAEAVRFELTVPFDTTVFKTVAINRTLPHFH